jgi:hypothetical protein
MRFTVGVTTEASFSRKARLVPMARVTLLAILMLTDSMEPQQARTLVAGRAGRRRRDAVGPVWPMTTRAIGR